MLTSCKLTGNPAAVSGYHTKEENYYFDQAGGVEGLSGDGETSGFVSVHGGLLPRLGLSEGQAISQDVFTNLLAGRNAAGQRVTREHKVIGIDLTFSAPKSVSVGALLTLRDPALVAAHDQAVLETMGEIERHCAGTKPTRDTSVKTGNLAYVTVRDGFNRDHDPHLHTHVVVMNMTAHAGKVMAVDGKQIMTRDFNKAWGAMYRAKLAANLKERGYSVSYTKKGEMRLDAVSLELEREFSGRRAAILAAKEGGSRDMEAWRRTRRQKDPLSEREGVLMNWQERAAAYAENSAEENRRAALRERERWMGEAKWSVEAHQEAAGQRLPTEAARWQVAARRATERSACATATALIAEYLGERARSEAWEPINYAEIERLLAEQIVAKRLLRTDDGHYTTWELALADRECLSAEKGTTKLALPAQDAAGRVDEHVLAQAKQGRRGLSERQQAVAAGVLESQRAVVVVQGDAGAGKTTMLQVVREVAARAGWETAGLAVQGVEARRLEEESGIRSTTLSAFTARERSAPAAAPRLLIVDEASMLDSRGLSELLRIAERSGDKLVLVGDRNQLQSVGAGKPFELLVESAEASGELLSLSENFRQRDARLRQAVDLARAGQMRESLGLLDGAGRVCEVADAAVRRREIAKLYSADTLILTGSRGGREALNKEIRGLLARRGELSASRAFELSWLDDDGVRHRETRELAVGERIAFLENEYTRYDVRNGDVGTIVEVGEERLRARLADGREVSLDLRRYNSIDYGYCLTTYKSQGQTYARVIVDADTSVPQLQDQRNSYVQITRARDDARIFTDDKEGLFDLAEVLSNKRDTLGLEASLAQASLMERRVCEEAFGSSGVARKGPEQARSQYTQSLV